MDNPLIKRLLRTTAMFLGIAALLCLLVSAGALIWLRTPAAENFLTVFIVRSLGEEGLHVSIGGVTGPLPYRLLIHDLRLADASGPFLSVKELEVALSLRQLVAGTLVVNSLRLTEPELLRLPLLNETEEAGANQEEKPFFATQLDLPVAIRLDSVRVDKGTLPGSLLGLPEPFLSLNAEGAATLKKGILTAGLDCKSPLQDTGGLGVSMHAAGTIDTLTGGMHAELAATAFDHAPWQQMLVQILHIPAEASSGSSSFQWGGELNLNLDLVLPDPTLKPGSPLTGTLTLQGKGMRWPEFLLPQALGENLNLKAGFSGGGNEPASLTLETLDLGLLHATGQAHMAEPWFEPGAVGTGGQSRSGNRSMAPGELEAELFVNIADLAPLQIGVSGPLALDLRAGGTLNALKATLVASSQELISPAVTLQGAAARLDGSIDMQPGGSLNAAGTIESGVQQLFGGPGEADASWKVSLQTDGTLIATLSRLHAQSAGIALNGDLTARVASSLTLEGKLSAEVLDWSRLSSLSGMGLAGGAGRADLLLGGKDARQDALMTVQLTDLHLRGNIAERGGKSEIDSGVFLHDAAGELKLTDIFRNPSASMNVRLGRGNAGPLAWSSGTARLDGSLRDGNFSLDFRGGGQAVAATGSTSKRPADTAAPMDRINGHAVASGGADPTDTLGPLAVRGNYNGLKKEVTLVQAFLAIPSLVSPPPPDLQPVPGRGTRFGIRLQKPVCLSLDKGIRIHDLNVSFLPGGSLKADLNVEPETLAVDASLSALPVDFFRIFTNSPLPSGVIDAQAVYSTPSGGPRGTISLNTRLGLPAADDKTKAARAGAVSSFRPLLTVRTEAALDRAAGTAGASGSLALRGRGKIVVEPGGGSKGGDLSFVLPMQMMENGLPAPNMKGPLTAALHWQGPADLFWRIAAIPDRRLTGRTKVDLAVSGSMEAPKIELEAFLADGRYEDRVTGLLLTDITLESHATPDGLARAVLALGDGKGGTLALEGLLTQSGDQASVALRGQVKHLQPLHRDDISLILSGLFGVNGPLSAPVVTANILVERGEVTLLSTLSDSSIQTLNIADKDEPSAMHGPGGPTCAVVVDVPGRFFIRGRGLDSEWQGLLHFDGPIAEPHLTGSLRPVRGFFDLLSKPFAFTNGEIVFTGDRQINPGIDLTLTYSGPSIEAVVQVGGTASHPSLTLGSNPPLPQDEVMAQVLFGRSVSGLSNFEALQLANGMRELAGVGDNGLASVGSMRKILGLDVLRVSGGGNGQQRRSTGEFDAAGGFRPSNGSGTQSNTEPGPTVEAGKYINDSFYMGIEQGATPESTGVRVEMELFPNVNIEGRTSPSSSQVGVGWRKNY
ncbi:MAG: translocation/assembly module TamB domain-containing protein [Desulfocapsaceae bacterium]|nr:translocation/assembly module TamB domain-containing protein [Desulfocapsaceae bacterium]